MHQSMDQRGFPVVSSTGTLVADALGPVGGENGPLLIRMFCRCSIGLRSGEFEIFFMFLEPFLNIFCGMAGYAVLLGGGCCQWEVPLPFFALILKMNPIIYSLHVLFPHYSFMSWLQLPTLPKRKH